MVNTVTIRALSGAIQEAQATAQTPPPLGRLLYSYREARALLGGVPASTFAVWVAEGLVVPVRIGPRRCFIRSEDLMRLAGGALQIGA